MAAYMAVLTAGAVLFFMNWWLLDLPFPHEAILPCMW